jgi:hypothetical protein
MILKKKKKMCMIQFKNKSVQGQREGTRSRTLIDRVHNRAHGFAEKYRAARQAKYQLVGGGPWELSLRVLLDSDIWSYSDAPVKPRRGPRRGMLEDDALEELERSGKMVIDMSQADDNIDLHSQPRTKRDGTGETRKELPWIWQITPISVTSAQPQRDEDDYLLRSEWAKS